MLQQKIYPNFIVKANKNGKLERIFSGGIFGLVIAMGFMLIFRETASKPLAISLILGGSVLMVFLQDRSYSNKGKVQIVSDIDKHNDIVQKELGTPQDILMALGGGRSLDEKHTLERLKNRSKEFGNVKLLIGDTISSRYNLREVLVDMLNKKEKYDWFQIRRRTSESYTELFFLFGEKKLLVRDQDQALDNAFVREVLISELKKSEYRKRSRKFDSLWKKAIEITAKEMENYRIQ